MGNCVEIENIEARRHQVGIDDVVLREDIRGLAVGDLVKFTLPAAAPGRRRPWCVAGPAWCGRRPPGQHGDPPRLRSPTPPQVRSTLFRRTE
ncbi:MAG TPA: hypothetical protein VKE94_05580 [Gemmataceae bacterium]|nr:hypothetical protein [Gemmataceae bacterium]